LVTNDAVAELVTNPNCDICSDPDTVPAGVLPPPASNEVTRVENDADEILNEPDIPAAVNGEANAPEISVAICAEPDNNPDGNVVINEPV